MVAIVHDYLTQRGGAERVVLAMTRAFPDAPVYTSLYEPDRTFPEFRDVDVRVSPLNRVPPIRRHHRLALPLLAPAFSRMAVDADVAFCSSSGWAHGAAVSGRKIVYCHAPARWLYQPSLYTRRGRIGSVALALLAPALARWDRCAAQSADRYLANSSAVRDQLRELYRIEAEVLYPPVGIDAAGPAEPVVGVEPGFLLCVARLLPYKNVDAVVGAARALSDERLLVVGEGPDGRGLRARAPQNVTFLGTVTDAQLRWLYRSSDAVVSASYEDFGLVPIEAAAFGKPAAVLRFGGFLDTVDEGRTGVFFDRPLAPEITAVIGELRARDWDAAALRLHAERFGPGAFVARLRELAAI